MCVGKGREREWGSPFISLITATDQNTEKQENRYSDKPGAEGNFPMGDCPSSVQGGEEVLSLWCCTELARTAACPPRGSVTAGHCPCGTVTHCRVAGGGQCSWTLPNGFGQSLDQGPPGKAVSVTHVAALGLLRVRRQSCFGSEMPAQITREMSNLCQVRICVW